MASKLRESQLELVMGVAGDSLDKPAISAKDAASIAMRWRKVRKRGKKSNIKTELKSCKRDEPLSA